MSLANWAFFRHLFNINATISIQQSWCTFNGKIPIYMILGAHFNCYMVHALIWIIAWDRKRVFFFFFSPLKVPRQNSKPAKINGHDSDWNSTTLENKSKNNPNNGKLSPNVYNRIKTVYSCWEKQSFMLKMALKRVYILNPEHGGKNEPILKTQPPVHKRHFLHINSKNQTNQLL